MLADGAWQHDLYSGAPAPLVPTLAGETIETGTKLYVSNLDFGVSNADIKELFGEIGELKRSSVHYDKTGRSKGTAEVVFATRSDAVTAMSRYNNVLLDGKPLKIELIGTNISTGPPQRPIPSVQPVAGLPLLPTPAYRPAVPGGRINNGVVRGSLRRRGRGGGRGRGSRPKEEKSQDELDAELDEWKAQKAEPMQT